MHLYQWSCFFLVVTTLLTCAAMWSHLYRDNLGECVAFFMLMVGCASRIPDIWERQEVPVDWFLVHFGLGLFFMSNAFKTVWPWMLAHLPKLRAYVDRVRPSFADTDVDWSMFARGATANRPPERRKL